MEPLIPVLLVEDEPIVREVLVEVLAEGGFAAWAVAEGERAVAELQAAPGRFRAVLTDIHLPGPLVGWDVARRARELVHDMPVVYMSGDVMQDWVSEGVPRSVMLAKPFAPVRLLAALAHLITAGDGPRALPYGRGTSRATLPHRGPASRDAGPRTSGPWLTVSPGPM
ncbi:response regulator [Roseomonas sp. CCTCC AB2023176]|uniref:response regulator n=1 Tax=Roseomonas sp. CCTCC AB2023176 TaxID=3342640 RepID=UPI0035D5D10E